MRYIFVLTWNIPRHKRDLGNALFGVFSGFEECFGLGWVSLCTCYSLLLVIYQDSSMDFCSTHTRYTAEKGLLIFRPTTTVSSLGVHTTTVVYTINTNLWPRRVVGPTRYKTHETVGSITWNPHYQYLPGISYFLTWRHNLKKTIN